MWQMIDSRWSEIQMKYLINHECVCIEWNLSRNPCLPCLVGILWKLKWQSLHSSLQTIVKKIVWGSLPCKTLSTIQAFIAMYNLFINPYLPGSRGEPNHENPILGSHWSKSDFFAFLDICCYLTIALNGYKSSSGFPPSCGGALPWKQFTAGLILEGQAWAWRLSRYRHLRIFSQKGAVDFRTCPGFICNS